MGLCKCRVVTNLFCFQHKQSVCDKCIASDHKKCVIKSYLQWLQDSDFDPNCAYCKKPMDDDEETIRFTCLDVFHKSCVEQYASSLPEHTAPAGFTCMACSAPIIPQENEEKPIAIELKKYLSTQSWAQPPKPASESSYTLPPIETEDPPNQKRKGKERKGKEKEGGGGGEGEASGISLNRTNTSSTAPSSSSQPSLPGVSSRKGPGVSTINVDLEEDKYKQRSGPLSRMFWTTFGTVDHRTGKRVINKLKLGLALILVVGLLFFFSFFSSLPPDSEAIVSDPN